ncbi:glutamate racemase [Ferrimonas marina]|uniref:Glutamate racemase n=1 Tax=Ferrimonas marina TaxID=299255 RepID=A0A1M5Z8J0_9GAMM|nr:glutamate racemase [Ferrimonas marina]SHI20514.1 glutamate racemase [Ferrimonas marina]
MGSIVIFDSGVGGLSIYQEIRAAMPKADIHYLADSARFPYGELDEHDLVEGCVRLIESHLQRHAVAMVVIACNSASTLVLEPLRQRIGPPVVGVVPAVKPAAEQTRNGVVGLLATPGTVQRRYTDELIQTFAAEVTTLRIGSSELVKMAEQKLAGTPVNMTALAQVLTPWLEHHPNPDTIVLGCTHFPLLREELTALLGGQVNLVDSGEAVARRVGNQVEALALELSDSGAAYFYTTGALPNAALQSGLKSLGFSQITVI